MRSRWAIVSVALAMTIAFVNAAFITPASQLIDDAFIFFRYADNFLAGYGLTWNAGGERVEGYTSALYLAVVVGLRAMRIEPIFAVTAFDIGCFMLVVLSSPKLLAELGRSRVALVIGPILVGAHTYFAQMARGGMEPMLFVLVLAWSLCAFFRAKTPLALALSGALFALAALTRPESLIDWGVLAAWAVMTNVRKPREAITKEGWRFLGVAALLLPHVLWRHAYYGDWLPNTFYAKVHVETWAQFSRGLYACGRFFASSRGALVEIAIACVVVAPRNRARDAVVVLMTAWIVYLLSLGLHDWNYYYSVPVDLFALLLVSSAGGELVELGVAETVERPGFVALPIALAVVVAENTYAYFRNDPLRMVLLGLAAIALLVWGRRSPLRESLGFPALALLLFVESAWWQEPYQRYDVLWNNAAIGKKLQSLSSPDDTLAIGAAGAIPYYAGLVTYDTLGLNDRHIARVPVKDPAHLGFGHERGDGAYILSKHPTYLVPTPLRSMTPGDAPWWLWVDQSFTEMFAMDEFRRDYHFEEIPLEGGGYFKYYRRNR